MTDDLERLMHQVRAQDARDKQALADQNRQRERDERERIRAERERILPLLQEFTISLVHHHIPSLPILEQHSHQHFSGRAATYDLSYQWPGARGWLLSKDDSYGTGEDETYVSLPSLGVTEDHGVFYVIKQIAPRDLDGSLHRRLRRAIRSSPVLTTRAVLMNGPYADPRLSDRSHYARMLGWHLDRR